MLSHVPLFVTPWTAASQASLSITNSWSLLKLMSIKSVMPSYHLILCHPLLLVPSIFPSIKIFSNESALCMRWPKYWSFSFNISPFNEYPGLISFRMDWLDLLAIQGTLKTLLQQHSWKASILLYSPSLTTIHDMYLFFFKLISYLNNYRLLSTRSLPFILNIEVCACQSQTPNVFLPSSSMPGHHKFIL